MTIPFLIVLLYIALGVYFLAVDMCSPLYHLMIQGVRKELSDLSDEEFKGILRWMKFYAIVLWPWVIYDSHFNPPDPEYIKMMEKEIELLEDNTIKEDD